MLPKAKPAQADRQRFQLHPSVNTWRTFDPAAAIDDESSLVNQVQSALQVPQRAVASRFNVFGHLRFCCDGSLLKNEQSYWPSLITSCLACLQSLQRSFRSSGTTSLFESRESAAYWAYHLGRMGFFTVQGVTGALVVSHTCSNWVHQKSCAAPHDARTDFSKSSCCCCPVSCLAGDVWSLCCLFCLLDGRATSNA